MVKRLKFAFDSSRPVILTGAFAQLNRLTAGSISRVIIRTRRLLLVTFLDAKTDLLEVGVELMIWTKLSFGKYVGRTLPQILFHDSDWFFWGVDRGIFKKYDQLAREAELLFARATRIKIPKSKRSDSIAEYYVHPSTRKFSHFDIVRRDQELHRGSSPAFRSRVIDMSIPHRMAAHDKLGSKNLLSSLKFYLFGSQSARITKKRPEAFFADPSNFKLISPMRSRVLDSRR